MTVTSSFNDISTDQLGYKVVLRGEEGVTLPPPSPPLSKADRYEDDVNGFSSISDICSMALTLYFVCY
jgi:hypothetical protein